MLHFQLFITEAESAIKELATKLNPQSLVATYTHYVTFSGVNEFSEHLLPTLFEAVKALDLNLD